MNFIEAMEIVLTMAECTALDENDPVVRRSAPLLEAAKAQKEALHKVRTFHNDTIAQLAPSESIK